MRERIFLFVNVTFFSVIFCSSLTKKWHTFVIFFAFFQSDCNQQFQLTNGIRCIYHNPTITTPTYTTLFQLVFVCAWIVCFYCSRSLNVSFILNLSFITTTKPFVLPLVRCRTFSECKPPHDILIHLNQSKLMWTTIYFALFLFFRTLFLHFSPLLLAIYQNSCLFFELLVHCGGFGSCILLIVIAKA